MKKTVIMTTLLLCLTILHANIDVVSETPEQVVVNFSIGAYNITQSGKYSSINSGISGYSNVPGAPSLPETTYYIAVPAQGYVSIDYTISKTNTHKLSLPLMPTPTVKRGESVSEYEWNIDRDLYQTRNSSLVTMGELQKLRYNYVIPVTVSPVKYDYNRSQLIVAESVEIIITISGNTQTRNPIRDSIDLSEVIVNDKYARLWQYNERVEIEHAPFYKSDFWYRLEIAQNGMHKLKHEDLTDLPLSDLNPQNIRIFTNGGHLLTGTVTEKGNPFEEIPILIVGEETGTFDASDQIIFYAENRDGFDKNEVIAGEHGHFYNPYSGNGVYWLTFGGSFSNPPKRIQQQDHGQHQVTRNNSPTQFHFGNESVRREHFTFDWYHSVLSGLSETTHNYNFTVNDIDSNKEQTITFGFRGDPVARNVNYSLSVNVNQNRVIDNQRWSGIVHRTFTGSGNFLQNGSNTTTLSIGRSSSASLYFDFFTVDYHKQLAKVNSQLHFQSNREDTDRTVLYQIKGNTNNLRAYEIKGFNHVSLLPVEPSADTDYDMYVRGRGQSRYILSKDDEYFSPVNFRSIVPVNLIDSNIAVDCIIITPEEFVSYAERLRDLYETYEDMRSIVVRQQDIFNQFNSGVPDPDAIRLFLMHAFHNYPSDDHTSLSNVVLLGSGTIDWRNFSGQAGEKNKIILYHRGSNTSDDFFVDMTGNFLPDIGIGRLTGQTDREMDVIFNKITNYRTNPTSGLWRNTTLVVADDEFTTYSSTEAIHSNQAQQVSDMLSPAVITDKLFAIEYPFDPFGNKPTARDDMIKKVNDGRLVWYYIGHGNYDLMGHESYFRAIDVQSLTNIDKLPMFIAASCDVGKFDYFSYNSLSERLLVHPNGGSIASLAATGLSSPNPNHGLMYSFLDMTINEYQRPGVALMKAKQRQNINQASNNRRYAYLGDPVLAIVPPQRVDNIVIAGEPDSLFALQPITIEGKFIESQTNEAERLSGQGIADILAYSSEYYLSYTVQATQSVINYSKWGNIYFRGRSDVYNDTFNANFIVPADIKSGNKGRILAYYFDGEQNQDFISYYFPKKLTNVNYQHAATDTIPPSIKIWLNSDNFRNGDIVAPDPTLYAAIKDESGINILGDLGHKILLMPDEHSVPVDVTSGFIYDPNSHTKGKLTWQLTGLKDGEHNMQLIVFDNYNNPAVGKVRFVISSTEDILITDLLPYPNPMSSNGSFTYKLNDSAEVTVSIYTIRGRKIRTLKSAGIAGFNQIEWDGKDQEGSGIANNTYIYKVRAKQLTTGRVAEEIGKVILLR